MSALIGRLQIRHILVALLAVPSLYLTFILYQTGNVWIALALLVVTSLGMFIYLNPSASTFRYLFPDLSVLASLSSFRLLYRLHRFYEIQLPEPSSFRP
jgi:hypothetical protein